MVGSWYPTGRTDIIPGMSAQRSIVTSAKLIAVCTLLSRITGLVREMLLAQAFGIQWIQDAFCYAFQIPNLFRRLLGEGAMAAVFVPTFTRTLEQEGPAQAWRLLARTLALLCVALVVVVVTLELVVLAIWLLMPAEGAAGAGRQLILALTALMLPFMLTICVVALLSAILNCVGSFVPAALAPVLLNIAMIAAVGGIGPALYPGDPGTQVYVVAVAVVAAGVLQVLFLVPVLRANGVQLGWRFEPRDPAVKRMLRLLVPVALGQGVLAFGVFLDAQICVLLTHERGGVMTAGFLGWTYVRPLEEGALATITYAQRLYQFPLGVLVISLATAAMPAFSRLAARQEWPGWAAEVRQSLRLAVFEGILTGTMMIALGGPIVRLLFEYRQFTPEATDRVSFVLIFYGLAMWAYCAQHILLRGFYSLGDVRTPLWISVAVLPLNVALTLALIWFDSIREAAFAISSVVTSGLAVVVGAVVLQRRVHTRLLDSAMASALARMLLAAGAGGGAAWLAAPLVQGLLAGRITARAFEALGPLAVGTAAFLIVAWLLRLPEVGLLVAQRRPRNAR